MNKRGPGKRGDHDSPLLLSVLKELSMSFIEVEVIDQPIEEKKKKKKKGSHFIQNGSGPSFYRRQGDCDSCNKAGI